MAVVAVSPAQSRLLECYKMNYYNDFDKKACAWLRELIKAGLIPDGVVDERSITDVTAADLCGFTQCHFFAGIGGWSRALQIAGWGEDRPVWTGSCPCQPFSTAGKGNGKSDERHLWPAFAKLISECRPPVVFGEQVESAIKHGWIDDLQADMEREDYAVGFAVLGAHSVGAPHIRQRLYWVANADRNGLQARERDNPSAGYGDTFAATCGDDRPQQPREADGCWDAVDWLYCRDGKWRPVESGTFPLADGIPGRVGLLRGYGNAIVPQVAAEFIGAFMEASQ